MPDQVMSKCARLISAIAEHNGPIRSDELERITGIGRKNHSGLLATAVSKGLVIRAEVLNGNRTCSEYRAGTAYTKGAVARMENAPPIEHIEPSERSLLRECGGNAQPAVASNTGSAALVTPLEATQQPGAAHPEQSKPVAAVQELANALDTIAELKRTIAELEKRATSSNGDPRLMIAALQSRMAAGIELVIDASSVFLIDKTEREYRIEPHEFFKFMDALTMLEERLAA